MGTDYNQPRDTGPLASDWDESAPRPAKPRKPKVRKRFGIEHRLHPDYVAKSKARGVLGWLFNRDNDWRSWQWYETAKQRDQAIEASEKKQNGSSWGPRYEYRACERD